MTNKNKTPIVVNLFGPPGSGKSTGAAYIFSKLKMAGINAELVDEFAKAKVWEESKEVFNNQVYILGKQYFKMSRCANKVDVIVTDSPTLLSILYNNNIEVLGESFNELVCNIFNSYNNKNYLINRVKPYNPKGRMQTEEESDALKQPLIDIMNKYNVDFVEYNGIEEDYDKIVEEIKTIIRENNNE